MARFKIGTKIYTSAALDEISLRDLMLFNTQAAEMGLAERWDDVERIADELDALSIEEAEHHPGKMVMIGVTVWASRRCAGEDVSLDEAVDIPLRSIVFLPDTEDKKPPANPTKRAATPKASAAATAPADD